MVADKDTSPLKRNSWFNKNEKQDSDEEYEANEYGNMKKIDMNDGLPSQADTFKMDNEQQNLGYKSIELKLSKETISQGEYAIFLPTTIVHAYTTTSSSLCSRFLPARSFNTAQQLPQASRRSRADIEQRDE